MKERICHKLKYFSETTDYIILNSSVFKEIKQLGRERIDLQIKTKNKQGVKEENKQKVTILICSDN